jgi:hypothetical protein
VPDLQLGKILQAIASCTRRLLNRMLGLTRLLALADEVIE